MKTIITAALIAAAAITAAACTSTTPEARTQATTSTSPTPTATAPAVPDPEGTYTGSCDYTLSDSMTMADAGTLIGEVDVRNTGNIGTMTAVRITWPQEGFPPVAAHRTVRVPAGQSRTVRFHVRASQNVISELQSWQEKHGLRDGCTYHAAVSATFGSAH